MYVSLHAADLADALFVLQVLRCQGALGVRWGEYMRSCVLCACSCVRLDMISGVGSGWWGCGGQRVGSQTLFVRLSFQHRFEV